MIQIDNMTSQTSYPSFAHYLCEACKEKFGYGTANSKDLRHRKKTSTRTNIVNNPQGKKCLMCDAEILDESILEREDDKVSWDQIFKSKLAACVIIAIVIFVLISSSWFLYSRGNFSDARSKVSEKILNTELPKLKQKYPNQKPELWHNVLKITNCTEPVVQVLILLHRRNSEVAECFARDLVKLINQIIKKNGIAVYKENRKFTEYGEELIHYLNVVREHNHLIVFQLNEMSGGTARMFHSLCDETPASVRPSFFIFTLEDGTEENFEAVRPISRASHILRNAWSNLMENELHPLIARVVRNVAEILPENITC